ncbi:MAG: hypothetical protein OXH12_09120, partial [Chloroflexi bacterium]|nr:hypothetical protein [Chloroflexota bacterium]
FIADHLFSDESLDPNAYDTGPTLPFTAVPGPTHELSRPGGLRLPGLSGLRQRLSGMSLPSRPPASPAPPPREPEVGGAREEEP